MPQAPTSPHLAKTQEQVVHHNSRASMGFSVTHLAQTLFCYFPIWGLDKLCPQSTYGETKAQGS